MFSKTKEKPPTLDRATQQKIQNKKKREVKRERGWVW